jgi:hypothetical protein
MIELSRNVTASPLCFAVTFGYECVNFARQWRDNLRCMKTTILIPILILLVALPVAADQPTLRYKLAGELQLTMEQEIYPGGRTEPLAGRNFEMTFEFLDTPNADGPQTKLTNIKGSYNAHGMNQRLSTSHLAGEQIFLASDGRSIRLLESGGDIFLGAITDGGLHPAELLVDVLPTLPEEAVSPGMTWDTERSIHSLEGWAWAGGEIRYHSEITEISGENGHSVVHVRSRGEATIHAPAGNEGFIGEGSLVRTLEWSFQADSGQLLSLSLEQEGTGTNQLPQGEIGVRQITRVELHGV